jgi:multidrug efflux pump subunit AcrA (membrane-fusion protein)
MSHEPAEQPAEAPLSRRRLRLAGLVMVVIAAIVVGMGITTRRMADARLNEWTERVAIPTVAVAVPDDRGRRTTIDLPGRLEAYSQAQLYARVSGYLKEWKADIGTPVKAGQLLAEIEAPDLDQQIMQAEAGLSSAQANAELASQTLQRGQSLVTSGAVSKQDLDRRSADSANQQGLVKSAQANLSRLRVLERYKQIVAPFDGLVTVRTTDVGALITAGSGGGRPCSSCRIPRGCAPTSTCRRTTCRASRSAPRRRSRCRNIPARPSRRRSRLRRRRSISQSGTTRMLLVVDNRDGALMTGAFATVRLELPNPEAAIHVPASALIFDQGGLRVATVGPDDRVVLKPVTIARDLGKEVQIATGLTAEDRVIETPPDGIASGDQVRIAGKPGAGNAAESTPKRAKEALGF